MRLGIRVARVSSRQGGACASPGFVCNGYEVGPVTSVFRASRLGHFQSRRSGARPTNRRAQVDTPLVWSDTYARIVYEVARGLR